MSAQPVAEGVKPVVRPEDRAPLSHKLAYGLGGMAENLSSQITKQMITPVFTIALGVSPATIGIVLMIFRFWDAMLDPIMGNISDNTRTRWGRRRPYIVVGGILTGLVLPLLWQASPSWSQTVIIGYLLIVGLLLYTVFPIWAMPYYSLGMEMTPDYNERTRIVAYRGGFRKAGGPLRRLDARAGYIADVSRSAHRRARFRARHAHDGLGDGRDHSVCSHPARHRRKGAPERIGFLFREFHRRSGFAAQNLNNRQLQVVRRACGCSSMALRAAASPSS